MSTQHVINKSCIGETHQARFVYVRNIKSNSRCVLNRIDVVAIKKILTSLCRMAYNAVIGIYIQQQRIAFIPPFLWQPMDGKSNPKNGLYPDLSRAKMEQNALE